MQHRPPGPLERPQTRPSDNDKLPLTQEAFIGVPDSPAATREVTVPEAPFCAIQEPLISS